MPTVIEGRVRLDERERELIEEYVGQPVNPQTVDEFNAWVDLATTPDFSDTPEEKLMKAVIKGYRVDKSNPHDPDKVYKTQKSTQAKVIHLAKR